jgi:RsiW-degrading membrane proteinase PrsW (M82 family)
VSPIPDSVDSTRKTVGWLLYFPALFIGGALFLWLFVVMPIADRGVPAAQAIGLGFAFALPMLAVYSWVPWIADRYDPEPLWALITVAAWGAFVATGVAGLANSIVGSVLASAIGGESANAVTASLSAPLTEETMKGLAVAWMFVFQRRQFDGLVDGVVYGVFVALGFAAFENVIYYSNAYSAEHQSGLEQTFVLRGLMTPWAHPVFTAMTGLGFGIARETTSRPMRFFAPLLGWMGAMFLHFTWNFAASVSNMLFLVMLPLWLLFLLGFFGLVVWLVARKGRIIRANLEDEVLLGFMTPYELKLVGSPFAHVKASFSYGGSAGRAFVDAAARLGLSKWHAGRASLMQTSTLSMQFVVPLRKELERLRAEIGRRRGGVIVVPKAGGPGRLGG